MEPTNEHVLTRVYGGVTVKLTPIEGAPGFMRHCTFTCEHGAGGESDISPSQERVMAAAQAGTPIEPVGPADALRGSMQAMAHLSLQPPCDCWDRATLLVGPPHEAPGTERICRH